MTALIFNPPAGAGYLPRLLAIFRRLLSRRLLLRLIGVPTVVLEGRVCAVRPVPLGIAKTMIPALIRCSRAFAEWKIDDELYADFIVVLALGLRLPAATVERIMVPLSELVPIVETIARVNGLQTREAGRASLGKLVALLATWTGTDSSPGSSVAPAGPGSTSSNA